MLIRHYVQTSPSYAHLMYSEDAACFGNKIQRYNSCL